MQGLNYIDLIKITAPGSLVEGSYFWTRPGVSLDQVTYIMKYPWKKDMEQSVSPLVLTFQIPDLSRKKP
jgi:hypothetical protein